MDRGEVHAVVADMTKEEDIGRLVEGAKQRFGGVDILVNNAGQGVRSCLLPRLPGARHEAEYTAGPGDQQRFRTIYARSSAFSASGVRIGTRDLPASVSRSSSPVTRASAPAA